jgi:hypothetical protein
MDVFSGVCLRSSLCRAYRKPLNAVAARRVHSSINSSHVEGSPEPDMRHVQINPEAGTVETPVGSLPISPFMDPLFYEARQRFTKSKPSHSPFKSTKFQRKLARNPYGRAPASLLTKGRSTKLIRSPGSGNTASKLSNLVCGASQFLLAKI